MKRHRTLLALAGVTLALAGCSRGGDDDAAPAAAAAAAAPAPTTVVATTAAPAPAPAPAAGAVAAKAGTSSLGDLLASTEGLTLYGFTNDVDAISTCYGTCAEAWPPIIVDADWTVGPGLDTGIFSTTEREDGTLQLVAGKFPLYTFGGDAAPGDITGHGSGDVWFAIGLDGKLLSAEEDAASAEAPETTEGPETTEAPEITAPPEEPAPVSVAGTLLGDVLVDADGMTLYGFTKDTDGAPTCFADCAKAWPPALVDGPELPAGLDPAVFTVVPRLDGTNQLKAGKWPLYRFAGDAAPGDANGQGSGGVWFVVDPEGGLIKNAG